MRHIHYCIGDGSLTSLWFDPWINQSPIARSTTDCIVLNSGLGSRATVADILGIGGWNLPSSCRAYVNQFRSSFDFSRPYNLLRPDHLLWDTHSKVSVGIIWQSIRRRGLEVDWSGMVWHKFSVPRFSCSLWLALHNGFKTKDILLSYGIDVHVGCQFCHLNEKFSHFFFHCNYTFRVLFYVMRLCGWNGFQRGWATIITFV